MTEPVARYIFKQLAHGVSHIHSHGLFHRDLKLENVVLDAKYNAKIMDFGHAKKAADCSVETSTELDGARYRSIYSHPPPVLEADFYSQGTQQAHLLEQVCISTGVKSFLSSSFSCSHISL